MCSKQEVRPPPSVMGGVGVSVYFFFVCALKLETHVITETAKGTSNPSQF